MVSFGNQGHSRLGSDSHRLTPGKGLMEAAPGSRGQCWEPCTSTGCRSHSVHPLGKMWALKMEGKFFYFKRKIAWEVFLIKINVIWAERGWRCILGWRSCGECSSAASQRGYYTQQYQMFPLGNLEKFWRAPKVSFNCLPILVNINRRSQ